MSSCLRDLQPLPSENPTNRVLQHATVLLRKVALVELPKAIAVGRVQNALIREMTLRTVAHVATHVLQSKMALQLVQLAPV